MRAFAALSMGFILVACEPPDGGTKTGQVGTNTAGTATSTETPRFQPWAFGIGRLQFGYDAATGYAVPVQGLDDQTGEPVEYPIELQVQLLNVEAATTGSLTQTNSCTVYLQRTDPLQLASWTDPTGAWFAFEVAESTGYHTCAGLDFPEDWGLNPMPIT